MRWNKCFTKYVFVVMFLLCFFSSAAAIASDKKIIEPVLAEGLDYLTGLFDVTLTLESVLASFPADAQKVEVYDADNYNVISNHFYEKQQYVHAVRVRNGELNEVFVDLWIPQKKSQTHQDIADIVSRFVSKYLDSPSTVMSSDDSRLKKFYWVLQGKSGQKYYLTARISCIGSADYGINISTQPIE